MGKLKTLIFISFLIFGIQQSKAQTYKFLTTGFSVKEKDSKGSWSKWSDLQPTSIIVTLDTDKARIVIYSQEIQLFDILKYEETEENENDLTYNFTCTDNDGMPFTISIITRKKQDNRKQLYITQKDVIVVYNIVNYIHKDEK